MGFGFIIMFVYDSLIYIISWKKKQNSKLVPKVLRFSYLPSKMKGRKGSVYIYFSIRLFQVFWDLPSYTITHLLDKNKILGRETQRNKQL